MLYAEHTPAQAEEVLQFWFGSLKTAEDYPDEKVKVWFSGGKAVDEEIASRFGALVAAAANHQLDSWKETPKGRLALIILLDQFPRNMYRGQAKAFAFDGLARQLTLDGLALNEDLKLFPIERVFFYLPLEHAEDIALQNLSLEKFHEITQIASPAQMARYNSYEDYAKRHYEIIAKFGRFPHRNAILNRASTPEEAEFLKQPGSSF